MLLLGFDTATPAVTVALCRDGEALAERTVVDAHAHGEQLAPGIEQAMRGHALRDLDGIVVGVGPGPFTGLRVGLVTARVLGATLGTPVHGVCTLDALALMAQPEGELLVATDARRREVYWARYRGLERVDGPHVGRPADTGWTGPVVGAGARLYPDAFPQAGGPLLPEAAALCRWVQRGLPTLPPEPLYLRRPDARPPAARKPALPTGR